MTRIPPLPPQAPKTGNRFTRWIGRSVLRFGGWTITGDWPDLPRLVVIAAPHSSGWDAVWGLAAKLAMGVDITFIAKAELFWGPLGDRLAPAPQLLDTSQAQSLRRPAQRREENCDD